VLALVDIDLSTGYAHATPVIREDETAEGALEGLREYLMPAARWLAEYAPGGVVYCPVPERPARRTD
jgi:hypothetical protein